MLKRIVRNRTNYLYEMDLALNNLHITQTTNEPTNQPSLMCELGYISKQSFADIKVKIFLNQMDNNVL